ncbi:recombinase family protein [Larkinella terrae]|uniref:Resolvase n=1 Tax=Larkinella terrae TaxID=2025311 RepID=A0A7K0EIF7_9BACT|nr:recombinase family protein [Larkinella terrae]MRS61630.1 resolvase [Larkinella terrae]
MAKKNGAETEGPQKYVAYLRVSTQKQGQEGLGMKAQEKGILDYCGESLIGKFVEVESGGKVSRKELVRAVELCKKNNAKLIAFRLDRILRSLDILVILRQNKVKFTALDCLNDSEMIINIKAAFAEEELRKVSERTRNALAQKKAGGKVLGKPENMNYAAQVKGAEVNKQRAGENKNNRRATAMVAQLRSQGKTFDQIAEQLNKDGFVTSTGKEFHAMQVHRLHKRVEAEKK